MKQKLLFLLIIALSFGFNGSAQWSLGDIAFSAYGSETATNTPAGPVDAFTIVLLRNVNSGEQISFTENGWFSAGGFRSGENTVNLEFTVSYTEGTQIIISADPFEARDEFGIVAGNLTGSALAIATGGDQIFAYDPANVPSVGNETGFIAAIHMNGDWNAESTSATTSAQPSVFTDGVNSISIAPEVDNARVSMANCTNFSDINSLRTMLNTAANWEVNNSTAYDQSTPLCNFKQTLSVNEAQLLANAISLTPNPVEDYFSLTYSEVISINKIEIYSITGQNIITIKDYSENTKIDMSYLRLGVYLTKIYSEDKVIVKKIIKK
jgi:hypothetical protein